MSERKRDIFGMGKSADQNARTTGLNCGQFIGRPQTFVELQLRFKLHFYTMKMQFET